jgi:hypothetical protein
MQPGNPPPGQDPFGQPPSGQPQPTPPEYAQPQYGPPQPTPPQYGPPQYGPPPATPPQYGPPQYGPPPADPFAPRPTSGQPQYDPYAPAPGYPPSPYTADYPGPVSTEDKTLGLLALVFGSLALPLACCWPLGLASGGAGVILGILGIRRSAEGQTTNRGLALGGLICGGIGVLLAIAFGALNVASFSSLGN